MVRFDASKGFDTLAKRMNDLAGEFEKGFSFEFGSFSPRIDITEDDRNLYFAAEMPGMSKDEVKLTINDENVLIIKGEKKKEMPEDRGIIRNERTYGEFSRSFMLPENIDNESINAKFENGILNVTFAKKEPEQPKERNIEIS